MRKGATAGGVPTSAGQDGQVPADDRSWFEAWVEVAYGPGGFWRRSSPAAHFGTASSLGPELALAVLALLDRVPDLGGVLEVGAGDGTLLRALHEHRPGLRLAGVDLRPRPGALPPAVAWAGDLWDPRAGAWTTGGADRLLGAADGPLLVLALEWLDDLPCPLAVSSGTATGAGWQELGADGEPRGPLPTAGREWLEAWWPAPGRAEVGTTRDQAWASLVAGLRRHGGLALMVDYGHERGTRPTAGSLAGYRDGHAVPAVPSRDRNLTAHVAVDAVQAAGERAGAVTVSRRRQREALAELLPSSPAATPEGEDPLAVLAARSRRAALASPRGWGDQWWLLQQVPPPRPASPL